MGRKEKSYCKKLSTGRVRSKDKGSDDSDEDYVVSDEEEEEASEADLEEYCLPLDADAADWSFEGLVDEEDEVLDEEVKRPRKVRRPKMKGKLGNRKIGGKRSRKRNTVVDKDDEEEEEDEDYEEEEEEEDEDYEEEEEDEVAEETRMGNVRRPKVDNGSLGSEDNGGVALGKRKRVSYGKQQEEDADYEEGGKGEEEERWTGNIGWAKMENGSLGSGNVENGRMILGKRAGVSYDKEREDDGDYEEEEEEEEDDDDSKDEEFTPEEDASLDEEPEEELVSGHKNKNNLKIGKRSKQKRRSRKRRKRSLVLKEPSCKRGRKKQGRKREKRSDDDGDFIDDITVSSKKTKKSSKLKNRRSMPSDSDFASSGPSDYEYAISEEEREQVREASKLLRTSSKSTPCLKKIQYSEDSLQLRKPPVRKGKEKVEAVKSEMIKQVCGICLSEEDKRRLRGTLDCCSHYFCFTCIVEWSKVESRCPLCKQRFRTISKPARSALGFELREVVIQVPERDQVYQPTEEELRSYYDPYENVICAECHQGGDDGLMLLCDLCDSSAHTYCVGLGREVPEGNWYCEGCRLVALVSTSSQAPSPSSDERTVNNLYNRPPTSVNSRDFAAPTLVSSPHTPFLNGFESLSPTPRFPNGNNVPETSPSGSGAPTLSRRRTLHRHIQNLLNINRLSSMAGSVRTHGAQQNDQSGDMPTVQAARTQEMRMPCYTIFEERPQNNNGSSNNHPSYSDLTGDFVSSRSDLLGREEISQGPKNMSFVDRPDNLTLWPEHAGISPISDNGQIRQNSSTPNAGSVFRVAPEGDFSIAREQLQLTVRNHLKNLSRRLNLGQGTFNEIATCSIHTVLAACGLEHRSSEVHVVPPPVTCSHEQTSCSLMKGCCPSCFGSFVKDVVKMIMDTRLPQWLSLGL